MATIDHYKNKNEFFNLLLYLFIAFILVYYVPSPLNKALSLIFIPIIWKTKRDYFWLAFIIILLDQPGGFFSGGQREDAQRLPLYSLGIGVSFSIIDIYLLILLAKSIKNKSKRIFVFFQKQLNAFFLLFLVLIVFSFFMGASIGSLRGTYKTAINLTVFYSFFFVLRDKQQFYSFAKLMFPFVFVAVLFQIYGLTFKHQPIELFKPGSTVSFYDTENAGTWERPLELVFTLFICFTSSLFFIGQKAPQFKNTYLGIINATSFLAIFLTGTRSWTMGFFVAYLFFLFIIKGRLDGSFMKLAFAILITFIVLSFSSVLDQQFESAWSRLSTTENLVKGDLSLGGTAGRYETYAPKVVKGFMASSIIIGAAFSDLYYEYQNIHVGYHNLLLNVGVAGLLVFFYFFISLFIRILHSGKEMRLASLGIVILLVINFGVQTIGFGVIHTQFFMLQAFSLALIALAYNNKQIT
ncbi:hypothetical protein DSECCO2_398440 [anaerobic digester metagenome]